MDALAAKPYGFSSPPEERTVAEGRLNFSRIIALRELMLQHGDGHKALWASAWGWNSLPTDWNGPNSIWGQVTAQQRRDWTLAALARAEREWPWLGGMILQHWQPAAPPDDPLQGFALLDASGGSDALAKRARGVAKAFSCGQWPASCEQSLGGIQRYLDIW